ncbi:ATP-binding protein [Streptomyces sp. NPDC004822]
MLTETPTLTEQFAPTPRGARLARHLAIRWLEERGWPPASDGSCAVALIVAELAANAVLHGRVPGRACALRLALDAEAHLVRIEVADAAEGRRPPASAPPACPEGESGRGLVLVEALAVRWGWEPRRPVGKTVWAEVSVEPVSSCAGMCPGTCTHV